MADKPPGTPPRHLAECQPTFLADLTCCLSKWWTSIAFCTSCLAAYGRHNSYRGCRAILRRLKTFCAIKMPHSRWRVLLRSPISLSRAVVGASISPNAQIAPPQCWAARLAGSSQAILSSLPSCVAPFRSSLWSLHLTSASHNRISQVHRTITSHKEHTV